MKNKVLRPFALRHLEIRISTKNCKYRVKTSILIDFTRVITEKACYLVFCALLPWTTVCLLQALQNSQFQALLLGLFAAIVLLGHGSSAIKWQWNVVKSWSIRSMGIWGFPEIGVPSNHPFSWDFHYKPSILGYLYPHLWKPPFGWLWGRHG